MIRAFLLCAAALPGAAAAQSLAPMADTVLTDTDRAALRLTVRNPGVRSMRLVLSAHEADWSALPGAEASRGVIDLAGGAEASVLVTVPMDGGRHRDFRICATGVPEASDWGQKGGQIVRGQVCGRYAAWRHGR